jgi:hypothetical protein
MAAHFLTVTVCFMQQGRPPQSARGLAQSKTLRAFVKSSANALRLGLRRPSTAFSWVTAK